MSSPNPILNNPHEEPDRYYATNQAGELDYEVIRPGRRIFSPDIQSIPLPQGPQSELYEINDFTAKSNPGQNILGQLDTAATAVSPRREDQLPRVAFKMATGTGKTVVMACLIL